MVVVTWIQASDLHDYSPELHPEKPVKHDAVRRLADRVKPDFVALLGDFVDGQRYSRLAQEEVQRATTEAFKDVDEDTRQLINLDARVRLLAEQAGGVQNLLQLLAHETDPHVRDYVKPIIDEYLTRKDEIGPALEQFKERISALDVQARSVETVRAQAQKDVAHLRTSLSKFRCPLLGVRGNHDLDPIYELDNIRWLEHTDEPIVINGISILGAPNTTELLPYVPEGLYSELEFEPTTGQVASLLEQFIQEHASQDDIDEFYRSRLAESDVHRRLQGKHADVLFLHKGVKGLAREQTPRGNLFYDHGFGLEKIVNDMKPTVIGAGHIHGRGYIDDTDGFLGLKTSDSRVYVVAMDSDTKSVEWVDVYAFVVNGQELVSSYDTRGNGHPEQN